MNVPTASSLFFSIALLASIARSKKQLRTFLYTMAAAWGVSFLVLFSLVLLMARNDAATSQFAVDTGRTAGAITAFIYSTKTRELAPKSVYLIGLACAVILLAGWCLGVSSAL